MTHSITTNPLYLAAAFLLLLLTGCSTAGDPVPENTGHDGFRIRSRATAQSLGTRAILTPDPTHDSENINSWIVVFYKKSDANATTATIEEICRSSGASQSAKDFTFIPTKITDGIYDIAAFANISETELTKSIPKLLFEEGSQVDLVELKNLSLALDNKPGVVGEYLVPMSGYRSNVQIKAKNEVAVSSNDPVNQIEVIRMYAKVEIEIQNTTQTSFTINKVNFGYVNKGTVPLFPNYDNLGDNKNASKKPPEILQLTDSNDKVADTDKESCNDVMTEKLVEPGYSAKALFYVRESWASTLTENGRFYMTLKFTRDNKPDEHHYADLNDKFQWIQRNDHILISVPIGDITMDWQMIGYPPIGGYPAIIKGENLTYTFSTPGKFSIRPIVKKGGEIVPSEYVTLNVSTSNDAIFKDNKKPTRKNDEIIGEIGSIKGKATLTCTLTVKIAENEEVERTQDITIVRQ